MLLVLIQMMNCLLMQHHNEMQLMVMMMIMEIKLMKRFLMVLEIEIVL